MMDEDWDTVWKELRENLQNEEECEHHPGCPMVESLFIKTPNDIIRITEDEIVVRSHSAMREDTITKRQFKRWWDYLNENGGASINSSSIRYPGGSRSKLIGAILAKCLPDYIIYEGNSMLKRR